MLGNVVDNMLISFVCLCVCARVCGFLLLSFSFFSFSSSSTDTGLVSSKDLGYIFAWR